VKKPTLTLKNKKKKWFLYPRKKKKPMKRNNFGDACGSWDEHNKSNCYPSTTTTILMLPQLHMAVAFQ
jgi:hypothetical protein